MIPPIIHQTWKTEVIPDWAKAWHKSWKTHNPDFQFKLWTDQDNRALVAQYAPWFLPTYDGFPVHIQRVDAVRYLILYLYGGVYADLDFECFRNISRFLKHDLVLSYSSNIPYITNAIMMSKPRHPFWIKLLKAIKDAPPKRWIELESYYVLRSTGPVMVDRVMRRTGVIDWKGTLILSKKYFFPFSMFQKRKRLQYFPHAYGAHQHMCTWTNQQNVLKGVAIVSVGAIVLFCVLCAVVRYSQSKAITSK